MNDDQATARLWASAALAWDLPACAPIAPHEPLGDTEWAQCFSLLQSQRGEGPLAWAIQAGWWPATAAQREVTSASHRRLMTLAVILERELLDLGARCAAESLEFRVLKGPAVAHLDEPDPSYRGFGDLDLLVRPVDLSRFERMIVDDGGVRRYPQPRAGFDERFSKGISFSFERNLEVDLHRTLASGAHGLSVDLDELFSCTEPFSIGGQTLTALDRPGRFLHAAYHAVLGGPSVRLTALRDLVQTAPADDHTTRMVLDRARRWRGEAVVARAIRAARADLRWRPPRLLSAWATGFEPSPREQRWLAAYVGGDRSYAGQMIMGLEAVTGFANRVAYARANATTPIGAATAAKRWRRGWRALRHSVTP